MTATYFNKRHEGHSVRGLISRENGGMAWSRLPATMRRGLTSKQAAALGISREWHHAGKYATKTYVYYPAQVEAFWASIDASGIDISKLLIGKTDVRCAEFRWDFTDEDAQTYQAINKAGNAAEQVRESIERSYP